MSLTFNKVPGLRTSVDVCILHKVMPDSQGPLQKDRDPDGGTSAVESASRKRGKPLQTSLKGGMGS